ncbi:hypothetical protein [Sporisorium scitamineum]|uniref:Uncharacterized protein n=1 Tax=Sporisorium scitamineum TaxID=49012 RepID=A0A0F7RWB4_9BASI|nr:hypothetical protein [Sporisorium scitamineum]
MSTQMFKRASNRAGDPEERYGLAPALREKQRGSSGSSGLYDGVTGVHARRTRHQKRRA